MLCDYILANQIDIWNGKLGMDNESTNAFKSKSHKIYVDHPIGVSVDDKEKIISMEDRVLVSAQEYLECDDRLLDKLSGQPPVRKHKLDEETHGSTLGNFTRQEMSCQDTSIAPENNQPSQMMAPERKSEFANNAPGERSFRQADINFWELKCEKKKVFVLKRKCWNLCYYQELLWCPCPMNNMIDLYSLDGQLQRTLYCTGVYKPNILQPLTTPH